MGNSPLCVSGFDGLGKGRVRLEADGRYHRKESPMAKKNENPSRKATVVKKLASQKPRPLQEKSTLQEAAAHGHDPQTTLVRGSMLKKMYYCFEDQSLEEVREMMRRHHLFHMPVVDKDLRIIGIVALCDVEDENVQKGGASS